MLKLFKYEFKKYYMWGMSMKFLLKKNLVMVSSLVSILLFLSACGNSSENVESAGASSEEPIELVVNSWFASEADVPNNVWKPWEEYVEDKTDGRVEVTVHYNGALASSGEILEGVQSGLFDVGMALAMYYEDSQLFPLSIGDLPFANDGDPDKDAAIMQEFSELYADSIWEGIIKIGVGSPPPKYMYSTSPITTTDFLKGKNVRVSNNLESELFKSLGGTPTEVAFEETYNALDKSLVDAMISTHDVYTNLQLVEVAPNFLDVPISFANATAIMNEDFFNSLPEDLQTLFVEDLNPKWQELFEENARIVMSNDQEVIEMAESNGGEVTKFEGDELSELQDYGRTVWDFWVEQADSKGYPGEQMMEDFVRISRENGVELDFMN